MKFKELSTYLTRLEKTPSRNEITQILADLFSKTSKEEIDKTVYLLHGQLLPGFRGIELNLAEKMMVRAIALAFGRSIEKVTASFKRLGDLGNVSQELCKNKDKGLSVVNVYDSLMDIAEEAGQGSQERKVRKMANLMSSLDATSCRFIARIPVGRLRLGFSDMTILDGLSVMLKGDKSARSQIEAAFNVTADIGYITRLVKEKGISGLKHIKPVPGTPIRPSLAERLPSVEKILEKVGDSVYVEPKYDGFRAQVHIFKEGKEKIVRIFSRNLENTTEMFPDLVEAAKNINVSQAIFDAEAIGYDAARDKFLPFQETVQRKRKHGISDAVLRLPLKLFVFDILFLEGKSLLTTPFRERRKILEKINLGGKLIALTRQEETGSAQRIRDLIKNYLSEGLEGALIKKTDAVYKAGGRGFHWVKYKKTTEEGVADTIDCLVMGIYKGKGKRAGFGAGAFLVGVGDKEKFKTVSKIGTGLTDEQWREMDRRATKLKVGKMPLEYEVSNNLKVDAWTTPSLVVEILADEITKSPLHSAGLALRFPRLIRFRDEKSPQQATSLEELTKLYKMQ